TLNASTAINPGGTIYGDNGANFTGNITDYHNIVTGALDVSYVYTSSSVPLPSTVLLLGAGLIGLAGFRRKSVRH
ncbi:MAG: VPLPA-CTERM sorting domain-containing protein, partial [Deltaproteobacteria bacterium]|nr:VPLPA-CTERM sorting domain-containing protein [Deltaproteobacteria bacterium]